ncbi:hypothetical protein ACW7G2_08720 [Luteimonas sp. A277]
MLGTVLLAWAPSGQARVLEARIDRIDSPVAVLHQVTARLEWPELSEEGRLRLTVGRVAAADLGYAFQDLTWECPLERAPDVQGGWLCEGVLRSGPGPGMRLAVDLGASGLHASLAVGDSRITLARDARTPDLTRIELVQVPLAWAQALVAQAWQAAQMGVGTLDGSVRISSPTGGTLGLDAQLRLAQAAFETSDASAAGEGLEAQLHVGFRSPGGRNLVAVDGVVGGGALLFGNAFIDLPETPVPVRVAAVREAPSSGWLLERFSWQDGSTLAARGAAEFGPDAALRSLDVELASDDASLLPARYLSGWLSLVGLAELQMRGGLDARIGLGPEGVRHGRLRLDDLDLLGQGGRFAFEGLEGEVALASGTAADSLLQWRTAAVGGLPFGPAQLALQGLDGELRLREPAQVELLGGRVVLDPLSVRLPAAGHGLRLDFGLAVEDVEVEQLAAAFGWPAFGGKLSGRIPAGRYEDERLEFEGGLSVDVFDGRIDVGSLSMDRPFGVAPTLSADLQLYELDLFAITEVFDLGHITGRLSGHVDGLRLVDWQLSAFDAELGTVPRRGVRQRISQRAVQNISSVGNGSLMGGLQGQLIGFFDDFGYSRIGISCRLENGVCRMGGLRSAGNTFTIVEGAGIPRLQVVGHNRNVDWQTLVERIGAAIGGDVSPVVD